MTTKYFNVKNGLSTGSLLLSEGNVTLGNVGNLHISGGNLGYVLRTDGASNLSWVDASSTQSAAPMPIVVAEGDTLTISNNFQGLFGTTLTINGTLDIDGMLIDVSGQGPPGSNSQVSYNDEGSPGATNGFTFNKTSGNLNVPGSFNAGAFIKCVAYSVDELRAITGVIGQLAVLNDSDPIGMPAYWDGTNNRWSYIYNNSAV